MLPCRSQQRSADRIDVGPTVSLQRGAAKGQLVGSKKLAPLAALLAAKIYYSKE